MTKCFTYTAIRMTLAPAVKQYRQEHLRSRAVYPYTVYGSSAAIRRATCVFCRERIATCSAKWCETKAYQRAFEAHLSSCAVHENYKARAVQP